MKKNLKLLTLVLSVVLFSACSSKKESVVVKNENIKKQNNINNSNTNSGVQVDMDKKMVAHFDFDKADIKYSDKIEINKYVAYLKKFPKAKIVIEGHTDSVGSMKYNNKLGIRRAIKVRDEIISQNINKKRIRLEYYGETMPVIDNKTPEHRTQNRRAVSRIIR